MVGSSQHSLPLRSDAISGTYVSISIPSIVVGSSVGIEVDSIAVADVVGTTGLTYIYRNDTVLSTFSSAGYNLFSP